MRIATDLAAGAPGATGPADVDLGVDGEARRAEDETACDPRVAAAMGGDPDAIASLWEEHRRWIAAVLLAYKPAFEDLEDLLQEVAMTFVRKVSTLRETTHLRAWLRVVAMNAARAAGRSGRLRPRTGDVEHEPLTAPSDAERTADANEATKLLLRRVEALPEPYRVPLLLRAMNGLSSRCIGDILEVTPATVDTRIARARRLLREQRADAPNTRDRT